MKKIFCSFFVIMLLVSGAMAESWYTKYTADYFGTESVLRIRAESSVCEAAWREIKEMLNDLQQRVSVSVEDSDIARFNTLKSGESVLISDVTAEIMLLAIQEYEETDGLFNPAVYPIVDLWGFTPRFNKSRYLPTEPYDRLMDAEGLPLPEPLWMERLLPLVDFSGIELTKEQEGWRLVKHTPDVEAEGSVFSARLDLGGLVKGYACDRAKEILEKYGVTEGYFTCGGSSMCILKGVGEENTWQLTLRKPRNGSNDTAYYATLNLKDTALSTSNDISQAWVRDGVVWAHILDPRTGWPVNCGEDGFHGGIISVTLTCESAARGDALSTALMLMGEDAAEWLRNHPEVEAVLVIEQTDGTLQLFSTVTEEKKMTLADEAYQ